MSDDKQFEILEKAIDDYIVSQKKCGYPARRQDIVEFCQWKNMPIQIELDRVGHLLVED